MSSPRLAWLNKMLNCKVNNGIGLMKRSKSLCSLNENVVCDVSGRLNRINFRNNESHVTDCSGAAASDWEPEDRHDSGIERSIGEELDVIEHKIDKLCDMFLEQCSLLNSLKEELRNSRAGVAEAEFHQNEIICELLKKNIGVESKVVPEPAENSRAKCLLDAIESSKSSVDREVRDVLLSFLQSEELKERMVIATADSVKDVIGSCLSHDISALYLPVLEHSHRRLLRHQAKAVEEAFRHLETYSRGLSVSVFKVSKSLQRAVERHRTLLEAASDPRKNIVNTLRCTVEELLSQELKQWRQKVLDTFSELREPAVEPPAKPPVKAVVEPAEAARPVESGKKIIDHLMVAVEITKQIERGEVNSAFERALSASDLSLVTAACRAAQGAAFHPRCQLRQEVLLALMQQLSTDVLHDTQLKCRYLEEAIIHLDSQRPETRAHLPLVVGEVRRHLAAFLAAHPSHVSSRRLELIVMAANNLLK